MVNARASSHKILSRDFLYSQIFIDIFVGIDLYTIAISISMYMFQYHTKNTNFWMKTKIVEVLYTADLGCKYTSFSLNTIPGNF